MSNLEDAYVQLALYKGWSVSFRKHPKTAANWNSEWTPHDNRSVHPTDPMYRKQRP